MSRKLDLGFIQPPPFALSTWSWLGVSILFSGLVLAVFTWQLYQSKQTAQLDISSRLSQLSRQSQQKKLPVKVVSIVISPDKKLQIQTTVTALTIPWNALLSAIEKSDTQDIALLSLDPSSKKQQVILTGEAKNLQSVLTYIQKLEAQPMLEKVYLQKHSVDEVNISKPVKFTVLAQWQLVKE